MSASDLQRRPSASLGDDLPPVQPPSAGFIIQLFVVPALIVLAVVSVWALFGRLAAGEQDWKQLVQEMESPNPHIYRRAMFGLAQLLDTDRRRAANGQQLASNPEIAAALANLLKKQLDSHQTDADTVSSQVYLTRALGLLDVHDTSLPALILALDSQYEVEVRKGAVTSIAVIAGRALERQTPLTGEVGDALVKFSEDSDPMLRRAAAFALGLVPGPETEQRLIVLLEDPADWMTSVNAAIALSRRDSTLGYNVFTKALATPTGITEDEEQDRLLVLRNVLHAIGNLAAKFTPEQRAALKTAVDPLANGSEAVRVRVDAQAAAAALAAAG